MTITVKMKQTMKRNLLLTIIVLIASAGISYAQKFCYVDTDYILSQSPSYQQAQSQLNQLSVQWQKEVEAKYAEIDKLYKNFQQEQLLLTEELRVKREAEIVQKEKEAKESSGTYQANSRPSIQCRKRNG
jgi:outer membrane protein